jgi:hypothetical protein
LVIQNPRIQSIPHHNTGNDFGFGLGAGAVEAARRWTVLEQGNGDAPTVAVEATGSSGELSPDSKSAIKDDESHDSSMAGPVAGAESSRHAWGLGWGALEPIDCQDGLSTSAPSR